MGKCDLQYLPSGLAKFSFGLATTEISKGEGGKTAYTTVWVNNLVSFGSLAETMKKLCPPGADLAVAGRFAPQQWTGTDGKKHYGYSFIIDEFQVFGQKAKNTGFDDGDDADDDVETANLDDIPF
jgi:single-stranded DNA-binding protein